MSAGTPASVSSLVYLTSETVRGLCGWDAREGELKKKIFWHSAELQATTKQQAGYPEVWGGFFSRSSHVFLSKVELATDRESTAIM